MTNIHDRITDTAPAKTPPVFKSDTDHLDVCSWCFPNKTLFLYYPTLEHLRLKVTHSICPSCLDAVRASIKTS
jgi:hypothetical protein